MVNFTAEKCAVLNVLMKMGMVMVTINQAYTVRYRQCNIQNYFVHKNCSTISTEILNLHLWNDDSLKVTKTKLWKIGSCTTIDYRFTGADPRMVRIGTGPPFLQINQANSAYFRLFLGYFRVISATRPPLLDLGPHFLHILDPPLVQTSKLQKF